MIKKLVSVIIPTCKNVEGRENPIDKCLFHLALSTYKDIEIITIDEGLERSKQRNIGLKAARGEYILYLDDDQYVSKHLIIECVYLMSYFDAVYIPEIIITNSWFGHLRNWERQFYIGTAVDCLRFFKRKDCPMFDERLNGPEDADFDHRIKGKRTIVDYPLYHDDHIGVIEYLKKKAYYTKSMELYKKKWPEDRVLDFKYRCFWIFIENGKWKRLIRRPHYALIMFTLIFARGLIYLCRKK